jgi:hypothetical protein
VDTAVGLRCFGTTRRCITSVGGSCLRFLDIILNEELGRKYNVQWVEKLVFVGKWRGSYLLLLDY